VLRCIEIIVEISLQHQRVAALHGKLVRLLLFRRFSVVVEVEAQTANDQCENRGNDERRAVLLFLALTAGLPSQHWLGAGLWS
jgi:hypothetical protein